MDTDQKMHLTKAQAKVAVRAMGKNPTEAQINDAMKGLSMIRVYLCEHVMLTDQVRILVWETSTRSTDLPSQRHNSRTLRLALF